MATTSFEKLFVNIPQLKSQKDWLVWKFQVTHALKAAGMWDRVTGTASREGADNLSQEQKVFYLILQCIGQNHVPMVMHCTKPKDLWDTLCQYFERKTVSNRVFTLMQLYGLRMKKGTPIQDHLRELDELSDRLTAIGEEVSDNHKLAVLLRSVQDNYPTLVTALLAKGDNDLTLVFVKQALLDEEQRHGRTNAGSGGVGDLSGGDTALKARRPFSGKKPRSGACHNCGQIGHYIRSCPFLVKDKAGHRAKTAEEASEDSDTGGGHMFVASVGLKAEANNEWIIDSGASRHT